MARRRMIDPHFWESGDVKRLDFFTRLFLIGMFSLADDEGRGTGGATYLKSVIFPHDEIPSTKIKKSLRAIQENISVQFYEVDGQEYYQFLNWKKWQRVDKPKESLLPPPDSISKNESENESENESKKCSKNESDNESRLKEKKIKEDKRREVEENAHENDDDILTDRLIKLFAENNGLVNCTPTVASSIMQWQEQVGTELVEAAILHCAKSGRKPWSYIEKCIISWHEKGLKTKSDVEEHEKKWAKKQTKKQLEENPQHKFLRHSYNVEELESLFGLPKPPEGATDEQVQS